MKDDALVVERLLIDVKDVAKMLNVCERTIRNLTKVGELPVVRIARRVLYSREDIVEFIRKRSRREGGDERESRVSTPTSE